MQRRWPPLVAAIIATVLVFLVLPNPLSIPQTNPSASAEYAPVPGDAQQAQSANFSQTSEATSAGVGSGGDSIGALPGTPPQQIPEFKPRQKSCVGNPPRQTEDPLSPPCVPFFEGDNGGGTYQGVTKDSVTVIYYNDSGIEGDLNKPWRPSDEGSCTYAYECENIVRTVKAQIRYFQRRYQTYGRTIRFVGVDSSGGTGASCASRQGDAATILKEHEPFAAVAEISGSTECFLKEFAERRIPTFGINFDVPARQYEELRPYSFGFFPDQETQSEWSASFLCRKIVGGTARFTDDPLLEGEPRKIGFIHPDGDSRGPELREQAALLQQELKRQCGYEFDGNEKYAAGTAAGSREASTIMSKFKQDGITTIVCYCIPVVTEATVPTMQSAATSLNYFPEWYWDHASAMDRPIWQQTHGSREHQSFGVTYFWRNPAFREQHHYQAYLQEEPGTTPNVRFNFSIYHLFLNLFQAIQAAGPDLTPRTVEQGMFTFNWTDFSNPWVPVGGYGPYSGKARSSYTFIDTAMGWWFDPDGTPPGGQQGEGCMRVIREGVRAYAGEWPRGDADLFNPSDPCSQDNRKLADPSTSGSV